MSATATIVPPMPPRLGPKGLKRNRENLDNFSLLSQRLKPVGLKFKKGERSMAHVLSWTATGEKALMCTRDGSVYLFDPERSGSSEQRWKGDTFLYAMSDPVNKHLAGGVTQSGEFKIWDIRHRDMTVAEFRISDKLSSTGKERLRPFIFDWSPDARKVAVGFTDDRVVRLDIRDGAEPNTLDVSLGPNTDPSRDMELMQVMFGATSDTVLVAGKKEKADREEFGFIDVCPAASLKAEKGTTLFAHGDMTTSMSKDASGRYMVSGGTDCIVNLWDMHDWTCVRSYGEPNAQVSTVGLSHDAGIVAWGSAAVSSNTASENNVQVLDTESQSLLMQIETQAPCNYVAWHPSRHVLMYSIDEKMAMEPRRGRANDDTPCVFFADMTSQNIEKLRAQQEKENKSGESSNRGVDAKLDRKLEERAESSGPATSRPSQGATRPYEQRHQSYGGHQGGYGAPQHHHHHHGGPPPSHYGGPPPHGHYGGHYNQGPPPMHHRPSHHPHMPGPGPLLPPAPGHYGGYHGRR